MIFPVQTLRDSIGCVIIVALLSACYSMAPFLLLGYENVFTCVHHLFWKSMFLMANMNTQPRPNWPPMLTINAA